jgi:hypothetical protein
MRPTAGRKSLQMVILSYVEILQAHIKCIVVKKILYFFIFLLSSVTLAHTIHNFILIWTTIFDQ